MKDIPYKENQKSQTNGKMRWNQGTTSPPSFERLTASCSVLTQQVYYGQENLDG
jgi:hypothetical protein